MSVVKLHKRLVEINSTEDVSGVQEYIVSYLKQHNETVTIDTFDNIIATKGTGNPHYILNTHFDTVPPHIEYEKDGDIISGRGAADAKGPLAVFLHTFVNFELDNGSLTMALTPDEESRMSGAFGLSNECFENPDGFIIGEPTGLDVCTSSKGYFEGDIEISGVSAHSSTPEDGCNAITVASQIIDQLQTFDEYTGIETHNELGEPILTPTLIEGGEVINQIPASCTISFSRRGVPPETQESFITHLRDYVNEIVDDTEASIQVIERFDEFLQPFETAHNEELVQTLLENGAYSIRAFTAATEASAFTQFDVPIVVFGPGHISDEKGPVAHSNREYISASELETAQSILKQTVDDLYTN